MNRMEGIHEIAWKFTRESNGRNPPKFGIRPKFTRGSNGEIHEIG